jgi:hypothetical protein
VALRILHYVIIIFLDLGSIDFQICMIPEPEASTEDPEDPFALFDTLYYCFITFATVTSLLGHLQAHG